MSTCFAARRGTRSSAPTRSTRCRPARRTAKSHSFGLSPQAWANPKTIRLVIGNSTLDVYPWQVDHALWNARYRNPYLFLTASQRSGAVRCEYDIINAAAAVSRM